MVNALNVVLLVLSIIAIIFAVFFVVNLLILTQSKVCGAKLLGIEKEGIKRWAFYEVEGEKVRNAYPTDAASEKLFNSGKGMNVRVVKCFGKTFVFDKQSRVTTYVGAFGCVIIGVVCVCAMVMM